MRLTDITRLRLADVSLLAGVAWMRER